MRASARDAERPARATRESSTFVGTPAGHDPGLDPGERTRPMSRGPLNGDTKVCVPGDPRPPIARLFEFGKVVLHGRFPELEAELLRLLGTGTYLSPRLLMEDQSALRVSNFGPCGASRLHRVPRVVLRGFKAARPRLSGSLTLEVIILDRIGHLSSPSRLRVFA